MATLGIDLGTSSVKVVAVDTTGAVTASATRTYAVTSPRPGWAEADPQEWLRATLDACAEVTSQLTGPPIAVGLSGQMHGVVLCSSDGTPVRPAIVWADTRSVEQAQRIRAELGAQQLARLGSAPFPGFAGVTLAWLADHEPQSLAQARWALQPKDWLRQQLTGHIATEPSDASGTLLYDLMDGGWSAPALEICGVRPELLAPISASADDAGPVTLTGSALTGIPVALGGADAACAVHGLGLQPGEGSITLGTGSQIASMLSPNPDATLVDRTLRTHTFAGVGSPGAAYFRLGAVQSGGLAMERALTWLGASVDEAQAALAEGVHPEDPYFWPFVAGERTPFFDPSLHAAWSGLSLATTRAAVLRSVLEGMVYAVSAAYDAVVESGAAPQESVTVLGGGSRDADYLKLASTALGVHLQPATVHDATAIGAARIAGQMVDEVIPPAPRSEHGRVEPDTDEVIAMRQAHWRAEVEQKGQP